MKLQSYWLDSAPASSAASSDAVAGSADVVIVGGGLTGLSAAQALTQRGASVVLLEAATLMHEASGRNGGHCNNGLPHDFPTLVARYGIERARAYYQAHTSAVDTVERLVREAQIDCDFQRPGRLKLAAKPQHYTQLARAAELLQREVDSDIRLVTAAELHQEIGSNAFHGGLVQTRSAQLHPVKFGMGLAQAAARQGARIHEAAAVTALRRHEHKGFEVQSTRGTVRAKQVLLATGCSNSGPLGWFRRRMAPVGSFIIATERLSDEQRRQVLPTNRSCVTSRHIGNYFRTTPDGRLLFGGRARFAMSNARSDQKSGTVLRAAMVQMFPQLAGVRIDYCWGGLVDITADRLPHAGTHDGLYYSMGYSGHGVQMAVHMGQQMARVMAGDNAANPWRDLAWPAIPGHLGKPWFLPLVGAYYRWLDLVQ